MRLRELRTVPLSIPLERPVVSSVRRADRVIYLLVEVVSDEGVNGRAVLAAFTERRARAVAELLVELKALLTEVELPGGPPLWDRLLASYRLTGQSGLDVFALSALDLALWDLHGRYVGAPIWELLGLEPGPREVYDSDGLWLDVDPSSAAEHAVGRVAQGFRALKLRFGRPDPQQDLAVLRAVRHAVGDEVRLMVDVNQGWRPQIVLRWAPALVELGVEWLEEPLPAEDVEDLGRLRQRLGVRLTAGENAYLPRGVLRLLQARAVAMLMPDLGRIGGVTGWLEARALAETWGTQLTSHLYPELSVQLLGPDDGPVEWVGWLSPLWAEPPRPLDGKLIPPSQPGFGLTWDRRALEQFRID